MLMESFSASAGSAFLFPRQLNCSTVLEKGR
jgi:hypothetical protein